MNKTNNKAAAETVDIAIRLHNGQNAYGAWIDGDALHQDYGRVEAAVRDVIAEDGVDEGDIEVGGQKYIWVTQEG